MARTITQILDPESLDLKASGPLLSNFCFRYLKDRGIQHFLQKQVGGSVNIYHVIDYDLLDGLSRNPEEDEFWDSISRRSKTLYFLWHLVTYSGLPTEIVPEEAIPSKEVMQAIIQLWHSR